MIDADEICYNPGNTFDKWNCGIDYTDDTFSMPANNVVCSGVWNVNTYNIVFDGNDYVRIAQMNYRQFTFESTFELSSIHSGWNTVIVLTDDDDTVWEEIKPKRE